MSYDRYDTRRRNPRGRSTLGYWVPLVLTVTVATAGLVAWVWSERESSDDDDERDYDDRRSRPDFPPRPATAEGSYGVTGREQEGEGDGLVAKMSGAIRRTPSPLQMVDHAGKMAAAGVAAAGAAIGLRSEDREKGPNRRERSVRREREDGFSDHERWSEEAVTRRMEEEQGLRSRSRRDMDKGKGRPKKVVAVVVSAEHELHDDATEHASILSHLPHHHNPDTTDLFVLIYAPHLTSLPSQSTTSSSAPTPNPYFTALETQATALVSAQEYILPFSTPTGYIHMLRHLAPQTVYIADTPTLSGTAGANIKDLKGWVGQVVVVVGDEGAGGLVDTETETETEGEGEGRGLERRGKVRGWWEDSEMVGLGKGVEVVDVVRVGDDWVKRVAGRE